MSIFAERLDRVKRETGLKKQEIAAKLNISRTMLYNYEKGENDPSRDVLLELAKLEKLFNYVHKQEGDKLTNVNQNGGLSLPDDAFSNVHMVPMVDWLEVGQNIDRLEDTDRAMIPTQCPDLSAFAVTLGDDPMMQPLFRDGDVIVVMPNTFAHSSSYALCKFKEGGIVFRWLSPRVLGEGSEPTGEEILMLVPLHANGETRTYKESDFEWIYPIWERKTLLWKHKS